MTRAPPDASASSREHRRFRLPISLLLAVLLAGLVAVTAGAILALTWGASMRNTFEFLNQRSVDLIGQSRQALEGHLLPAERFARKTALSIERGAIEATDRLSFSRWLMGAMTINPQIRAIAVIGPDRTGWSVHRVFGPLAMETATRASPEIVAKAFEEAERRAPGPFWAEPVHVSGASLINLRTLIPWPDGQQGMLVIVISLQELSDYFANLVPGSEWTRFILYGRDKVLAHLHIAANPDILSAQRPLLPLDELPDPVLQKIWEGSESGRFSTAAEAGATVLFDTPANPETIFILGETQRFGDTPWYFGAYTSVDLVNAELERARASGILAAGLAIVAIIAAILAGQRLAKPLRRSADAAIHVGRLELDRLEPLPGSPVRELDEQAKAFNRMAEGLRAFSTYVPKPLVSLLAKRGFRSDVPPVSTDATVLFTDIAAYTSLTEHLSAADTAALLNHHFALLGGAINEEGGIIDKYIGDSLMAFWAPPLSDADGPARAAAAARKIAVAITEDNRQRAREGQPPLQVRIGIHTGPTLVGNIGAPGRVNYTVVGDTVNVAQRLQDYGRHICPQAECIVLASAATVTALAEGDRGHCIGPLPIRGREEAIVGWQIAP